MGPTSMGILFWLRSIAAATVLIVRIAPCADAKQAEWTIGSNPVSRLGAVDQTDVTFAEVVGATRLANGNVIVGDHGDFALREFSPTGVVVKSFGRKGGGPGEIRTLRSMHRCGDSLFTVDLDGRKVSTFSLEGRFVRQFRFAAPHSNSSYRTACNGAQRFVHYGWEAESDMRGGTYRPLVPFWTTGADGSVEAVLGRFPGSERFGLVIENQLRGSRPLPLGRETQIAIGSKRVYLGIAEAFEVQVFSETGANLGTLKSARPAARARVADVERARSAEILSKGKQWEASVARDYSMMQLRSTLPAYDRILVDSQDWVWVRVFPRAGESSHRWIVFDTSNAERASVVVPAQFEVLEIGSDYVLGRYVDDADQVPEVRLYELMRASQR